MREPNMTPSISCERQSLASIQPGNDYDAPCSFAYAFSIMDTQYSSAWEERAKTRASERNCESHESWPSAHLPLLANAGKRSSIST
jgi:hypothetical protein